MVNVPIRRRGFAAVLSFAVVVIVVMAFGLTAPSGAAVKSLRSGTSGVRALSGQPIAIGNIGDYSGAEASGTAPERVGIQAWARWTNAHGGINGHPVKLYVMDDALDPTTAVSEVQTLVNQDHVVAIVGEVSTIDSDWASIASQAGVPVVGGLSLDIPFLSNSDFFATGANAIAANYGIVQLAKKNGNKMALLYCAETPTCAQEVPLYQGLGPALGVQVPVVEKVSGSQPDYTAVCQAIKSGGVQSYYVVEGPSVVTKIANTCKQQGVTAKLIEIDGIMTTQFVQSPGTANVNAVDLNFPFFDSSVQAARDYQAAIKKYYPSVYAGKSAIEYGPSVSYGWVAGQLFAAAVKASGKYPVTPASTKQGLYKLKNATLGGLTAPLTYTPGKPTLINCYFFYKTVKSKFIATNGLTPTCAPNGVIDQIASKL